MQNPKIGNYWSDYLNKRMEILIKHEGYSVAQAIDTVKLMEPYYEGKDAPDTEEVKS